MKAMRFQRSYHSDKERTLSSAKQTGRGVDRQQQVLGTSSDKNSVKERSYHSPLAIQCQVRQKGLWDNDFLSRSETDL